MGATQLELEEGRGIGAYVQVSVYDGAGKRLERQVSTVQPSDPNPKWSMALPAVTLTSDAYEIVCKVDGCFPLPVSLPLSSPCSQSAATTVPFYI